MAFEVAFGAAVDVAASAVKLVVVVGAVVGEAAVVVVAEIVVVGVVEVVVVAGAVGVALDREGLACRGPLVAASA